MPHPELTQAQREEIRKRCEAATSGPWEWKLAVRRSVEWLVHTGTTLIALCGSQRADNERNAEFIAHARTDIPALLDALDARDALLQRVLDAGHSAGCARKRGQVYEDAAKDCTCPLKDVAALLAGGK